MITLIVTLLKLLSLFTVSVQAEESSILNGATIFNPEEFDTERLPDPDLFFGVGFKALLHTINPILDHLGDGSQEIQIKMTETHTVITVFLL